MDATIDFFQTVTIGHWLGCACAVLALTTLDGTVTIPENVLQGGSNVKLEYIQFLQGGSNVKLEYIQFLQGGSNVKLEYIQFLQGGSNVKLEYIQFLQGGSNVKLEYIQLLARKVVDRLTIVDSAFLSGDAESDDHMYNYTRVMCHYGALMIEFRDAWAEGNSERVVRCWRLFMPHFRVSGCTQLLVLSPNLVHQVMWHRFVNTKGGLGNNIPCDLHNEHVNKLIKTIIQNMGSNLTENSLQRAVRCVSPLYAICKQFDRVTGVPIITSAHSTKSLEGGLSLVVAQVLRWDLITQMGNREHNAFPNIHLNPLDKWDKGATERWFSAKRLEYGKLEGGFRERFLDGHEECSSGEESD